MSDEAHLNEHFEIVGGIGIRWDSPESYAHFEALRKHINEAFQPPSDARHWPQGDYERWRRKKATDLAFLIKEAATFYARHSSPAGIFNRECKS